jgi:hypothetical protein
VQRFDDKESSSRVNGAIKRLVHVAPFWAGWKDLGSASQAYRDLITRLSEVPGRSPASGRAFFVHDHQREVVDRRLDDRLTAAGADRDHLYPVWRWLEQETARQPAGWIDLADPAAAARRAIVEEGLTRCERGWIPTVAANHQELLVDQLNLFSVRFFFRHEDFDPFLCSSAPDGQAAPDDGPRYFVCIDLRFDFKVDVYWTFATLSLWSDWPRHPHIAPRPCPGRRSADDESPIALEAVESMRSHFDRITRCFEGFLHGPEAVGGRPVAPPEPERLGLGWSRPRLEVFDGVYRPPRFWFAVPVERPATPMAYLNGNGAYDRLLRPLAETVLKVTDPRAGTVATAQVQGDYLVQRRFIHDHHGTASVGDEPTYLLIPGEGATAAQEEVGYRIARSLLQLEWYAATVLFEVDSDLEVARTHVKMYENNARQAGTLLDALVLHLPATSGEDLRVAHESIELVHQTLLQGVADLADMTTIIQASVRKVGDGADELMARFDRELDQQAIEDRLDIRASLAERGLFDRLREQARDDVALADRVQTRYQSLLQEITMAFEERRVREGDKLERYSGIIALIFGVVGVVTAAEALLEFRWLSAPLPLRFAVGIFVTLVGAVLLGVIGQGLLRYRHPGKLGTGPFRQRYRETWSFLATTSTPSLRQLKASIGGQPAGKRRERWNEADERFSRQLAERWDQAPQLPALAGTPAVLPAGALRSDQEIRRLATLVEAFVCETLLVSERTPELHRFALPRFTCLYRLLSTNRDRMRTRPDSNLVSDFDVRTSLTAAGFPAEHWETFLTWERELLAHQVTRPVERPAHDLLVCIEATAIQNGLDPRAGRAVVDRMWRDIERWRTATYVPVLVS